jgi:acetylornithine deacetylase/succinyl-diaminopimelate desuccinylase-like protein
MVSFRDLTSVVDADRGAMGDLLAALVAIPTENPPATGYLPCVAPLESTLTALRFPYERIDIASPPDAPRAAVSCGTRSAERLRSKSA